MIPVDKPDVGPPILSKPTHSGVKETAKLKSAYEDGERSFEFKSRIYGAKSVKSRLVKLQNQKCAFCESKFMHIAYGDVEHFRPKGGWVQSEGDVLTKPGYYWLAYSWANLLVSCTLCNQRFKKNLFPLIDPTNRAYSHQDDLQAEEPLLIDPQSDTPSDYMFFREEFIVALDDSPRGEATIALLGLNRIELEERRRDVLAKYSLMVRVAQQLESKANVEALSDDESVLLHDLQLAIQAHLQPDSEYLAMIIAASED